jgi:protoporphyrinogen oxidase
MIVIIGAGPAGLSAAYHLEGDYVLLEQGSEVGGLCRSFQVGDCTFDIGGHAFFTRHAHVRELLWSLLDGEVVSQPRSAWVYSHGTYVPYPFQANLHGLPQWVVQECLSGLDSLRPAGARPPDNLDDWLESSFGIGIAKHFLRPYNEKLWAHPLTEIEPSWTGERLVRLDPDEIVAGALAPRDFRRFPNSEVSYPAQGGFSSFFTAFLPHVCDRLQLGTTVTRLNLRRRFVETNAGERISFDGLISTIPLTSLVAITDDAPVRSRQAAGLLAHNSLHLVSLAYELDEPTTFQRVYVADPAIPFHKVVMNSNSSPMLRALPHFGVQAEISSSPHKPIRSTDLVADVVAALRRIALVPDGARLVARDVRRIELAYPISTHGLRDARKQILDDLAPYEVHCAGRFGEWRYVNSDDAVNSGLQAARRLLTATKTIA